MYEDYFGLDRPPFKITPDTSLFYEGGKRGDILGALVYAIQRGEGIIKVVGEVGSGKTMLCRMLQLKLPDTVEIVYIANPSVSPEHLLQDYLLQRHMENKQVVLFIEEAQGMPLETLEEIRLLSNLETDQNKLLQIILFGQPELDDNLSQQSIRQLRERITHNFNLAPLTQDEIHNYLNFRMREVGYTGPELINPSVAKKVEQYSEGLLRRINIIADKILLSAFAEGTHNLSPKHVTAAVNDSTFNQETPRGGGRYWLFGLIVAVALAFALFQTRSQWLPLLETAEMPAKRQNVAINDKPITDIATQVPETSETVPVEARDRAESQVDSAVVEEPPEAPLQQAQTVARLAESPGEQADANDQQSPAASPQTQSADDVRQETEVLMQQVEAVVQQVEAAVQQANIEVTPEPAPLEEDPVLQKALDQATSSAVLATEVGSDLSLDADYNQWLNTKLRQSLNWLSKADRNKVSIQVFVRSKSAARELVYYLRNEWPLDLSKTYLYEVNTDERGVYRVFYNEFDSLTQGRAQLERLPDSVKINSPYLHSVYRMQKALL
jgi:type II secretory pathway predicted ATPase ExeA